MRACNFPEKTKGLYIDERNFTLNETKKFACLFSLPCPSLLLNIAFEKTKFQDMKFGPSNQG